MDRVRDDETEEDQKRRRLTEFFEAREKAVGTIRNNLPFYPKSIYEQVDIMYRTARSEARSYKRAKVESDDYFEKGRKNADKIVEMTDALCKKIRERIDP